MKRIGISLLILMLSFSQSLGVEKIVELEPAVVELVGSVIQEEHYGPPGFGQNPESDAIDVVPILVLSVPVTVKGGTSYPMDLKDVEKIQLIMGVGEDPYCHDYVGKEVKVSGTLFTGHNNNHYTRIVMSVQTIETVAFC